MRERAGQILKAACYVLAALLLYQLVQVGRRLNPLAKVVIPALPRLDADTNTAAGAPASGPARPATNAAVRAGSETGAPGLLALTNRPRAELGTNSIASKKPKDRGADSSLGDSAKVNTTNSVGPLTPILRLF